MKGEVSVPQRKYKWMAMPTSARPAISDSGPNAASRPVTAFARGRGSAASRAERNELSIVSDNIGHLARHLLDGIPVDALVIPPGVRRAAGALRDHPETETLEESIARRREPSVADAV